MYENSTLEFHLYKESLDVIVTNADRYSHVIWAKYYEQCHSDMVFLVKTTSW